MEKVNSAKKYIRIIEITTVQLIIYLILVTVSTILIVNSYLSFQYIELQLTLGIFTFLLSIAYIIYCLYRNNLDIKKVNDAKIAFYNSPEEVAKRDLIEKKRLLKIEKQLQAQVENDKQIISENEISEQLFKFKIKQEEEQRIEEEAYQERVRQQEEARQIERDQRKEAEKQLIDKLRNEYENRKSSNK